MLDTKTVGYAPLSVTLGAAGCLTCLLVLMGLKLKWFRARMSFDQPPPPQVAYVGVYRSTFSASFDDFDSGPPPESIYSSSPPPYSSTLPPAFDAPSTSALPSVAAFGASSLSLVDENEEKKKPKGAKPKEPKVKAVPVPKVAKPPKEPKAPKEVKPKEPKAPKDVKPKEPKPLKEVKQKEPKPPKPVKEPKAPKEPKVKPTKDSSKKKDVNGLASQNNAFPVVQASNGAIPKAPPMQSTYGESSLPEDGIFTFVQAKSTEQPMENIMPAPKMKTFGSMQPTRGQVNTEVTPIPQKGNRGFRNPAARGMDKYVSPTESSMQMFYGMEEESET